MGKDQEKASNNPFSKLKTSKALLPVMISCLSLAGCGSSDTPEPDTDPEPIQDTIQDPVIVPPTPVSSTINLSGGFGNRYGGYGGGLYVEKESGIQKITVTDILEDEASFTAQTFSPDFGSNPLMVDADMTIARATVEPAANEYYHYGNYLYLSDGDTILGNEARVTGVSIAEGASLTLDAGEGGEGGTQYLYLDNDFELAGTLVMTGAGRYLRLYPSSYLGRSSGAADLTPAIEGGVNRLYINADYALINAAALSANGLDSETGDGGDGGTISLYANTYLENSGELSVSAGNSSFEGGEGGGGEGGEGGYVYMGISGGPLFNSGNITAMGGTGTYGGNGGSLYIEVEDMGQLIQLGNVSLDAADGSEEGGSNGYIEVYTESADAYLGGSYSIAGGDALTIGGAGSGGGMDIYMDYTGESAPGDLILTGSIDFSGGLSIDEDGASGGYLDVEAERSYSMRGSSITLAYSSIDISGGDAGTSLDGYGGGGYGGYYELYTDSNSYPEVALPSGAIENLIDVDVSGGFSEGGEGGEGGYIEISTNSDGYGGDASDLFDVLQTVTNTGNLDANGGAGLDQGSTYNARGGRVTLEGYMGVANSGSIEASGGSATASDGIGGDGNYVNLLSEGPITNSATIDVNGGNGGMEGGEGGYLNIAGTTVNNTASLSVDGGNATPELAGSIGGDAGFIDVETIDPVGSSMGTNLSATPGTGETAGDEGYIENGMTCSGDCENNAS